MPSHHIHVNLDRSPGTMAEAQVMQPSHGAANKKRKRPIDSNTDDSIVKRANMAHNNDHLNGTFPPDDFAQQLQSATQEMAGPLDAVNAATVALGANMSGREASGLSFTSNGTGEQNQALGASFDLGDLSAHQTQSSPYVHAGNYKPQPNSQVSNGHDSPNGTPNKPVVGTEAWHKQRRDNHKEGKIFFGY
jgi:hypothetical protein